MNTNDPGREPEPTDAELLRKWADTDRHKMACAADHSSFNQYSLACVADANAHRAAMGRGREYLSGARPMPEGGVSRADALRASIETLLKAEAERIPGEVVIGKYSVGGTVVDVPIYTRIEWRHAEFGYPVADPISWHRKETPAPDEQDATLVKLIDLLTRTANAVKGQPGELKQHGWADLPDLCAALAARVAELEALMREAVSDFHGHRVLFSARFLEAVSAPGKEPTDA